MFRILIAVILVGQICVVAHAQQPSHAQHPSHTQHPSRSRRITKAFTEPIEQSIAASPEVGIIVEANVKEGDRVRVGDTLAKINQRVLVKSLAIAEAKAQSTARLDAATSKLELLKSQLKAVKSLVAGGHTNKFEVEQTEAEYQNAYADFRMAEDEHMLNKLEVERIRAQVEDRTIGSPINGFVTEIHKRPGENVSSNDPKYATIVQVDKLKVRFYLEEATLNQARPGEKATILLGPGKTSTLTTITYVSPIIDPDSGLGRLDVQIDNSDFRIKSGTVCFFANVGNDIQTARAQDSLSDIQNPEGARATFSDQHQRVGQLDQLGQLPIINERK